MIPLAVSGLEKSMNAYIRLDPDTVARLKALSGKVIKLEIVDWNCTLFFLPYDEGLHVLDWTDKPIDVTIRGRLVNLMKIGLNHASSKAAFKENLEVLGDVSVGTKIQRVMADMDIDWEEHLSKIIGDIAAHNIASGAKKIFEFASKAAESLKNSTRDYVQREKNYLVPKQAVDDFYEDIAKLRHDVERAEAKIHQYKKYK